MDFDTLLGVGGIVVGTCIGVIGIATSIFADESRDAITWVFATVGFFPGELSGDWDGTYTIPSGEYAGTHVERFSIRQLNNYITATSQGKSRKRWRFRGRKNGNFIIGTWKDTKNNRSAYYGTFEVFIEPNNIKCTGKWLGHRIDNSIISGDWTWRRVDSVDPNELTRPALQESAALSS